MKSPLAGNAGRALPIALSGLLLPVTMSAAVFSVTAPGSGFIHVEGRSSKNDGVATGASPATCNYPADCIDVATALKGFLARTDGRDGDGGSLSVPSAAILPGVVSPGLPFTGSAPAPVLTVTAVPEPSSVLMFVGALAVFFLLKRVIGRQ